MTLIFCGFWDSLGVSSNFESLKELDIKVVSPVDLELYNIVWLPNVLIGFDDILHIIVAFEISPHFKDIGWLLEYLKDKLSNLHFKFVKYI